MPEDLVCGRVSLGRFVPDVLLGVETFFLRPLLVLLLVFATKNAIYEWILD